MADIIDFDFESLKKNHRVDPDELAIVLKIIAMRRDLEKVYKMPELRWSAIYTMLALRSLAKHGSTRAEFIAQAGDLWDSAMEASHILDKVETL